MGLCGSSNQPKLTAEENKGNEKIEAQLKIEKNVDKVVHKLLLLGAGESGKSTLFKQMINLYGKGFTDEMKLEYKPRIYENIVTSMKTLCRESQHYGTIGDDKKNYSEVLLKCNGDEDLSSNPDLSMAIEELWQDTCIKKTFERRSAFQCPDSASYFFDNMKRIAEQKYVPNNSDVLRVRIRTTGIVENEFIIENNHFKMYDVGGQRTERKKWIHCFENVTAVIFVAALSEYDQMLFEDETTNRMKEALNLFEVICNSRWFARTSMILFLNKRDLFQEKITKVSLRVCFEEYTGQDTYEDAAEFIEREFLKRNTTENKEIFPHKTDATDPDNISHVFNGVKETVISQSLMQAEIL
eukprot:TRINITY_DN145_c0_g1_i5.p1 TRINITY_DN145_c0_g1~~TRINITY_DN145_c0_g1_i5.p1  ORF type:complete len:355 (-),score=71.60 TRINITY_DN145_c0_g1_i5:831-1895(-)